MALVVGVVTLWGGATALHAQPMTVVAYGQLRSTGGGPAADGDYVLTFSLYDGPKAPVPKWTEAAGAVSVVGGRFAHVLGSVIKLPLEFMAGATAPQLGVKVGADPELPRQPLHSVPYALHAGSSGGLSCSGCIKGAALAPGAIDAQHVGFKYAGSTGQAGPALSALDLQCTGCVSVSELKLDADLKLGGNGLVAKLVQADSIVASTVSAAAFVGSGAKLTGIQIPSGTCPAGQVVTGVGPSGALLCAQAVVNGGAEALPKLSSGLLSTRFVEVAVGPKGPLPIPDNDPIGLVDEVTFPDLGTAVSLTVHVTLNNSDIGSIEVQLFDPSNAKHVLHANSGDGKKLEGEWPIPDKPVAGDLGAWKGKNPKGKWRLRIIDSKSQGGPSDGTLQHWRIEATLDSDKRLHLDGDLRLGGDLLFEGGEAKLLRVHNAQSAPIECGPAQNGMLWYSTEHATLYICSGSVYHPVGNFALDGSTPLKAGKSCQSIKANGHAKGSGSYWIKPGAEPVLTWCDMTTAGGGWTLVATVHEDNVGSKCDSQDKWTSTKGNSAAHPKGDGNWENEAVFGSLQKATSADYKSRAYFEVQAKDVLLYHVPDGTSMSAWHEAALLRYHTSSGFLAKYGGTLRALYKDHFPVGYGGKCSIKGLAVPVLWDKGGPSEIDALIAPHIRKETTPGFVQFRVFNGQGACNALCPGVRFDGCNTEHACIGGGGWFPQGDPKQCSDFSAWDWDGYNSGNGWSASKTLTDATVFILVR